MAAAAVIGRRKRLTLAARRMFARHADELRIAMLDEFALDDRGFRALPREWCNEELRLFSVGLHGYADEINLKAKLATASALLSRP